MSETNLRWQETVRKQSEPTYVSAKPTQEADMRHLIFAIALLAVASVGITASFAAVHHAKTPTFAERFAPALEMLQKK